MELKKEHGKIKFDNQLCSTNYNNDDCSKQTINDNIQQFVELKFVENQVHNVKAYQPHQKNYSSPNVIYANSVNSFKNIPGQKKKTILLLKRSNNQFSQRDLSKIVTETATQLFYQVQKKRNLQNQIQNRQNSKKNDFYQKLKSKIYYESTNLERNYMTRSQSEKQKVQALNRMLQRCQNRKHNRRVNFSRKQNTGQIVNSNVGGKGYQTSPVKSKKTQNQNKVQQQSFSQTKQSTKWQKYFRSKLNSDSTLFPFQKNEYNQLIKYFKTNHFHQNLKPTVVKTKYQNNLTYQAQQASNQNFKYNKNNILTDINNEKSLKKIGCIKLYKRKFTYKQVQKQNYQSNFLITNRINLAQQYQEFISTKTNEKKRQKIRPKTSKAYQSQYNNMISNKIKGLLRECQQQTKKLGQIKKNMDLFGYYCEKVGNKLESKTNKISYLIKKQNEKKKNLKNKKRNDINC